MPVQLTPQVSASDVERIARRDFPAAHVAEVLSILEEYKFLEPHRVRLAVLKLASGSLSDLRSQLEVAMADYRDVLLYAEWPLLWQRRNDGVLSDDEQQQIYDADWKQHQEWFHR